MMKQYYLPLLSVLYLLVPRHISAQDLLYLRNNKTPVKVKVYEIGIDEIKYKPWGDTVIPVMVLPKLNVSKIVLEDGSVHDFSDYPLMDPNYYEDQHHNAFKVHFLSPLFSNIAFSYERSLKPGRSYEAGMGIIGVGIQYFDYNVRGMYGRLGYKFILAPNYSVKGIKYVHILSGGYIKPEVVFGGYGIDREDYLGSYTGGGYYRYNYYRREVSFGGLLVNMGKQWVVDDTFVFDMYVGFGYGVSSYTQSPGIKNNYYDSFDGEYYHYAFFGGFKDFPFALSAGFKMGFTFGKRKGEPLRRKF